LLNHTILTKDDAVLLLDTAKNFKNSKLITDILKESAPPPPPPETSSESNPPVPDASEPIQTESIPKEPIQTEPAEDK
jgi:hypothetical protein